MPYKPEQVLKDVIIRASQKQGIDVDQDIISDITRTLLSAGLYRQLLHLLTQWDGVIPQIREQSQNLEKSAWYAYYKMGLRELLINGGIENRELRAEIVRQLIDY